MRIALSAAFAAALLSVPASAYAQEQEAEFLETLSGNWAGGGSIRLKPEDNPVDVNCELSSDAGPESISMAGNCSAMIIVSRAIGADLSVEGESYSGTYIGSPRGPATLAGSRSGETVNLQVAWPQTADRSAREATMQLSSAGGALQITTSEAHPETGEQVVTAQLSFQRQ